MSCYSFLAAPAHGTRRTRTRNGGRKYRRGVKPTTSDRKNSSSMTGFWSTSMSTGRKFASQEFSIIADLVLVERCNKSDLTKEEAGTKIEGGGGVVVRERGGRRGRQRRRRRGRRRISQHGQTHWTSLKKRSRCYFRLRRREATEIRHEERRRGAVWLMQSQARGRGEWRGSKRG